jgi:tetratricopeptide (TPR) repeat protein
MHKWLFFILGLIYTSTCFAQKTETVDTIPEFQKLYTKALSCLDSGKYKDALPLLKKVSKLNKEFHMAHTKSAYAYMKLNEFKDAEKAIKKSEEIMPLDFETQKIKGMNYFFNNKFKESKTAFDTALVIAVADKIDDAELYYYRAQLMYKGKSYKQALLSCESAIDINPTYIEAFLLKGEIRFETKEYNHALRDLTQAIKLMPAEKQEYKAYKTRAKVRMELKDYKGSANDWSIYIDAVPVEEEALIGRAAALINGNDNSKAISDLDEAIKMNSNNPVSYCLRGVAKGGNKSYAEAMKDLDYSIKLKFDYAPAYVNRAAIKMALKQKEKACDDLQKADSLGDKMAYKLIEQYCKGR